MLNERLFLSFRHVTYSMRGGFLVRPLTIALTLGCAGAVLSALEEAMSSLTALAPRVVVSLARRSAGGAGRADSDRGLDDDRRLDRIRHSVDVHRLVFLARSYGVVVRVVRRVGHFVPAGVPLLMVSETERLSPGCCAEFRGAFDIGATRTLQQDIEFGILPIVGIALRAISPAVNDPSTAIETLE